MKKTYTKPEAELFSFYSDEEITSIQTLDDLSCQVLLANLEDDWK